MSEYTVRQATLDDIPKIVNLGYDFYVKSNFSDDGYDPVQMAYTTAYSIEDPDQYVLVAVNEDNVIVGFISFDVVRYYTTYPVAHMFLLYPDDEKMGYFITSKMVKVGCEIARERGAKYFYGSSSAEIDEGRSNEALRLMYKRQGFEDNGFFMRKEL